MKRSNLDGGASYAVYLDEKREKARQFCRTFVGVALVVGGWLYLWHHLWEGLAK